jgi:hypothetical protein
LYEWIKTGSDIFSTDRLLSAEGATVGAALCGRP